MKVIIEYCINGEKYTEEFTEEGAREELKNYGYPLVDNLSAGQVFTALQSTFNLI